ncbi:unnamed protein product [Alopecurus aequalis]
MVSRGVQPYTTEAACLINTKITFGGAMARGPIQLWNEWAIQILILFSFTLQIFLFVFARTRRRGTSTMLRILLWLAYLLADSTAVYTLGHLSISTSGREQKLTVFWAPFLLVHLGSQDTITAYALEDNQLWPRHLLNLSVQACGVAYIVYKHIAEIPTFLRLASVLMCTVGVIKYGERIWALKCATLDSIRSSIRKPHGLPSYYGVLPSHRVRAQVHVEEEVLLPSERERDEELLLFAQGMLPLCKGSIANFPLVLTSDPVFDWSNFSWNWNWNATFKVVEMELSLMYDILYTKAAAIHTWYGYCIRFFSTLATIAAFILFQLSGDRNCYGRTDIAITYILLVGAILLDMASMFSALGSTWTCNFLLNRNWSRLGLAIMSIRRHVKAATSNRGWSGSIRQFNLLHFGSRDKTKLTITMAKMMGLEDWWNKWYYSETLVVSEDVKELVFKCVWQVVKKIHHPSAEDGVEEPMAMMPPIDEWPGFRPELYDDTARRRKKLDDAMNFGVELQEVILTWHVFTDVFLSCCVTPEYATSAPAYLNAIKALSDYMMFLVAVHPDTIPGLELRSLYESTRTTLCLIWSHKIDLVLLSLREEEEVRASRKKREEEEEVATLTGILQKEDSWLADADYFHESYPHKRAMKILIDSSVVISHGALYARLMLELADARNPNKASVISRYKDIDGVAMDKLKHLMPDLESSCRDGDIDMPKVLALILDTWVHVLVLASVRCRREAHARQISRGSDLTTVVWLMEEHAGAFFSRPDRLGRYMEA